MRCLHVLSAYAASIYMHNPLSCLASSQVLWKDAFRSLSPSGVGFPKYELLSHIFELVPHLGSPLHVDNSMFESHLRVAIKQIGEKTVGKQGLGDNPMETFASELTHQMRKREHLERSQVKRMLPAHARFGCNDYMTAVP